MIKVNAISLNETHYYTISDADKPYIREIRSVYCYNPESCTHLCELTPSYDLRYLHTYIVWEQDPSEEVQERLEMKYTLGPGNEDTYMHCSDVRQFAKDHPAYHKEHGGEYETIEDACEYLQGNWPF